MMWLAIISLPFGAILARAVPAVVRQIVFSSPRGTLFAHLYLASGVPFVRYFDGFVAAISLLWSQRDK